MSISSFVALSRFIFSMSFRICITTISSCSSNAFIEKACDSTRFCLAWLASLGSYCNVGVFFAPTGVTGPACTGSLGKFVWPWRWPYMSFHASALLNVSSFGPIRTTEPYMSCICFISIASRPRMSAEMTGRGERALRRGPGNLDKGWM